MAVCRVCGGRLLLQVEQRERNWRKKEGERLLQIEGEREGPSLSHDLAEKSVRSFVNSKIKTSFLGRFIKVYFSKDEDRTYFIYQFVSLIYSFKNI